MSGTGRFTGCDLGGIVPLFTPWNENCGLAQPVFSKEAALLSRRLYDYVRVCANRYDIVRT